MENFLPRPAKSRGGWFQDRDAVLARFNDKIIPEPNSGCWLWLGCTCGYHPHQYGNVKVDGKMVGAHRRSWQLSRGKIPMRLQVLHRCDNGLCVNPEHLWLGTPANNSRDRNKKGRHYRSPRGSDGRFISTTG
jgi:hypothetical protein